MGELRPCQFCGGKAKIYCELEIYCVMCTDCGAIGKTVDNWHEGDNAYSEAIATWNRRAQTENARRHTLQTGVCPMCEDCPDGCPVEAPNDSRNKPENEPLNAPKTNADRIRGMSDEELAKWLVDATVCERVCHEDKYCHGNECVKRVTEWLQQPAKEAQP